MKKISEISINAQNKKNETKPSYNFNEGDFAKGIRILQSYGIIHWELMQNDRKSIEFKTWYNGIASKYTSETFFKAVRAIEKHDGYMTLGKLIEYCEAFKPRKYPKLEHNPKVMEKSKLKQKLAILRKQLSI